MVKHGKKDSSTMPTHAQGFQPLTWEEYVACQISIGSNLIQQRNLRDLNGLFDTSGDQSDPRSKVDGCNWLLCQTQKFQKMRHTRDFSELVRRTVYAMG